MTMHLIRGVCTLSTRKPKQKITKAKQQALVEGHRKHNQFLKSVRERPITLDDYIKYVYGVKQKQAKKVETYKPTASPSYRSSAHYPSVTAAASPNSCAKTEPLVYSGEQKLLGIATLHKSCLQPVFDAEYAKDVARMRRN
jgi:hypothetical protein